MSVPKATDCTPYFELTFRPNVELISVVRRFVSSFYDKVLSDRDATSRLALATHELLENATKYSTDGETTIRIEALADGIMDIRIRIWNRAREEHLAVLRAHFAEIIQISDPFAYYQRAIEQSAKRRVGSGLGLARLLAEADMKLSCEIEGDRVCIVADTYTMQKGRAA